MAVKGIGSNYLYPVQNDYKLDSKTEDTKNAVSQTAVQKEGVSYEKTIPDSVSAGLEYIQGLEKQISGTKFFVGTVSYGQTYGNSSDINFVVNPKFLGKLGTGHNSFADKVSMKANSISNAAARTSGTYKSNGTYNNALSELVSKKVDEEV